MNSFLTTDNIILLAVVGLFGIGLYGLLVIRNLIKIVAALQVLVKAAVIALVLAGKISGQPSLGQSLAVTVIVADTIVAVIGLALAVAIRQRIGSLDLRHLDSLKG
jgi:NADH:ubiquinone oxidoreductase subunit K